MDLSGPSIDVKLKERKKERCDPQVLLIFGQVWVIGLIIEATVLLYLSLEIRVAAYSLNLNPFSSSKTVGGL
jgi:hypothetical protein